MNENYEAPEMQVFNLNSDAVTVSNIGPDELPGANEF